ncbi:MAG: hypothetical protein GY913_31005 [Proteobacteria bacterium]|nr:hypothetical protein [Pseudomonadota bacterium]MCP4921347.1 hypothetical protein [Pseudomonadota bacterium]
MRALLMFALIFLTGCATKYGPLSGKGGYVELPNGKDTFDVSFSGNGMVPPDLLEAYLLYRCAEVAESYDYDFIIIEDRGTEPKTGDTILPQYVYATIQLSEKEPRSTRDDWYEAEKLMDQLDDYVDP